MIVVAGFGNPLRSDDGAGWRVADTLAERWGDRVTVLTGQQPLPEWAPQLARADVAYFVDTSVTADARPRARRVTATDAAVNGHALSIEQLLGLARSLYGRAPRAYVIELPIESAEFGERLSPRTAAATERAIRVLDRRLARLSGHI